MRFYCFSAALLLVFATGAYAQSSSAKYSTDWLKSYGKYVEIAGATRAGADVCATCHEENSKDFRHAFHAQQGVECEDCHGNGSLHVQGGGDISKIVSFRHRSATDANGVCLGCHARDEKIRNWVAGPHASNKVRCTECHQTHSSSAKAGLRSDATVDVMTAGRVSAVENVVPESKAIMQPSWQGNDACLTCHQTQRGEMSLPYHHPLREGKMSCADCHDPHGGAAGNNLRTANKSELCLSCHAQYRGPFAYQHPPVTEDCMICHTPHGSPNTNLLTISEPALCLQCHAGHHNGSGLPLVERCTNCHGSIHGTDVATPSGGSRFVDKGPYGLPSEPPQPASAGSALRPSHPTISATSKLAPVASRLPTYAVGAGSGALGMMSSGYLPPLSGQNSGGGSSGPASEAGGCLFRILRYSRRLSVC
jgi:DmsE family decaheme c-type cytochrome